MNQRKGSRILVGQTARSKVKLVRCGTTIWAFCTGSMLLALAVATACKPLDPVATSHVDANVPGPEDFNVFLERDLTRYFSENNISVVSVKHEMLREDVTQSGVAYPKVYVWVWIIDKTGATQEGAVRLAAIDRSRFEVTDFLSKERIVSNPASIESVFPQPVCEKIREKLK